MGIYYSKLSTYFNTLYSKLSSQNTCASICKLMIYRHRTLVLACTVYSTPDVHAFFDKRFFYCIFLHISFLGYWPIVKVSRSDVNQIQQQQQRDIRKIKKSAIPQ